MEFERDIQMILRLLGVNGTYQGFPYTVDAILLAIQNRDRLIHITKDIYPDVAVKYHTHWKCVEKNIRTLVEAIWKYGDRAMLEEIGGEVMEERPKNTRFIEMISDYIVSAQGEAAITKNEDADNCKGDL